MESDAVVKRYGKMPKLCEIFDISPATVRRKRKSQGFPKPIYISSNCARYDLAAVERWFESHKAG
jgi:predicted DNA-binding transcriptional regulator AlpA